MPKVLPNFLEVRYPWWGHWARLLWSYDWWSLCLASSLHVLKLMAAVLRCLRNIVFVVRVTSKTVRRFRNRKSTAMRHRPNWWWYIRIHKCRFFLHERTILNRGHHTEITGSTVVARHPPNHGHSKRHTTSFSIHLRIEFGWTRSAAHVWCPLFVLVPYRTAEIQEICLFYCWSNRKLPWGKCHFSANITEVIRVIYALLGHFDKHTTQ